MLRDGRRRTPEEKKQKLTSRKILINGQRSQQGCPRPYKTIQLKYLIAGIDLNREYVRQAVEDSMTKFCSVAATLRPGVKINYNYEILSG